MTQKPQNPIVAWIDHRLPVFSFMNHELNEYPTPKNLNYFWNFGSLAGIMLVIMIVTGIVLAMHYTGDTKLAFGAVERIMRDVNHGWLIRYIHQNGASMFFIVVYIHIFRGMYYGSYKPPREILWGLGVLIFLLMMATAFMGYVLPWGQMSFWGATVITNLFSAIPVIGETLVTWLWGGFSVDNPTLTRFFALHYLMPFLIVGVVILHIIALHRFGSNNPLGIDLKEKKDSIPFHPYYTIKDLYGLAAFLIFFSYFIFFAPGFLGHPDNYTPANPMVTPPHIVPEWYFLPFYAILRAVTFHIHLVYLGLVFVYLGLWAVTRNVILALLPTLGLGLGFALLMWGVQVLGLEGVSNFLNLFRVDAKLGGVIAMFGAVAILFILPLLDRHPVRSSNFRPLHRPLYILFLLNGLLLGVAGAKPTTESIHLLVLDVPALVAAQIATFWYFFHFLVILPVLSQFEPVKPLPASIGSPVLQKPVGFGGSMQPVGAVHKEI